MPGSRLNVHLFRDSFNTPWGFRLQGGKDLNQPLTVQRVFSNSPAEGELQRGDIILSINNRDASQLTHKQAQDLIKHGGGQVQLTVNRPPPGAHMGPLSPPIVTHQPRAPSLQSQVSHEPPFRQLTLKMADTSSTSQYNGHYQKSPASELHSVNDTREPHSLRTFERQRSSVSQPPTTPTPTTPVPPWAAQQFTPKKISKLSKLGGGGFDFAAVYATLPRGSSAANYGGRSQALSQSSVNETEDAQQERRATGPIPKVCHLRQLGGGGYDFGSNYGSATLPRRSGRRLSQPVGSSHTAGHGFQPAKVTLNKFGGGGPEFGSDFSHKGYGQTPAQRYEPRHDKSAMLNRVQTSLDNLTLSPRTPEVHTSSPFYQPYEQSYQPPQQVYTPTGLLLEQQRLQEQQYEGEAIAPVWERRKQFQQGPDQRSTVRTPANKAPPRIPKPSPGSTSYGNFGIDYSHPSSNQSQTAWRPAPQFKPAPAPVQTSPAYYTPKLSAPPTAPKPSPLSPSYASVQSVPPAWQRKEEVETATPAWSNSLKKSGPKPWEAEASYADDQQAVRSVPYNTGPAKSPISPGPFSPSGAPQEGGSENGPKVVHLQYNSPFHLYSNQNVTETLKGQTQAMSGQPKPPAPTITESGERDWSQSAVLRFITNEESKKSKQPPPAVAPKPLFSPVQAPKAAQPFYHEVGASEF